MREALAECDPAARHRRDEFAWALLRALYREQPGIDAALCSRRYETGIDLSITIAGVMHTWFADSLFRRAGTDTDTDTDAALVALTWPTRQTDIRRPRSPGETQHPSRRSRPAVTRRRRQLLHRIGPFGAPPSSRRPLARAGR
ncbi:MAG TPA: hypothetical protein VNF47_20620 [Streptosporangiaceae bacterium]|nr:hypothetical protein [Streptosporangiaceae bacterium]